VTATSIVTPAEVRRATRPALLHSLAVAAACALSYAISRAALTNLDWLSHDEDVTGPIWSVIATVFVYRTGYAQSLAAAVSRGAATLVSFALCLAYLLVFPFAPVGMVVLIGIGTLTLTLFGRPQDAETAGITTAVVFLVAALSPHDAWEQPVVRLAETAVGAAVGLAAAWSARTLVRAPGARQPASVTRS
jgi:uncharacterized membrane protein YccC